MMSMGLGGLGLSQPQVQRGIVPPGYAVLTIGGDPVVDADGNVYIVRETLLQ